MLKTEELNLVKEWDKVFPKSDKVNHSKVVFPNHFGITLAADLYVPKNAKGKLPAIAVSGPFGACKEQSSGLYAQTLAERGFLTIAFDPCIDTRIKATVTSTMYDMSRIAGNGYFDSADSKEDRKKAREAINAQRTEDFRKGNYARQGGVVDPLPEDAPFFVKDYHDYYKTPRGYHARSLNSNEGWNASSGTSLMNTRLFTYAGEIDSAVLMVHGENAHSCYMSRDAFKLLKGENKELLIIPDAVHTDLYDGGGKNAIPFDKMESFFKEYLK